MDRKTPILAGRPAVILDSCFATERAVARGGLPVTAIRGSGRLFCRWLSPIIYVGLNKAGGISGQPGHLAEIMASRRAGCAL